MSLPSQTINMEEIVIKYPHISKKMSSMYNAKPRLLIGQDNWPLLVNRKMISGPWNSPALSKTLLGWVIHGNVSTGNACSGNENNHVYHINQVEKDDFDLLHDMVKKQWQMDNFGIEKTPKSLSKEDIRAQYILDQTMKRNGERYETGLLWKDSNLILPESYQNAMKRLLCTERKIDKNQDFGKTYVEKMVDMEGKGYIRKLTEEESKISHPKTWYLPHFGVINPNKPNKMRVVFDAASKSNGVSLNDCLLPGPDLYNSLYKILLNFRIKKIAFTADIKEMFLQVQIRQEDRCAQRILWRGMERNLLPDIYEIGVVFFGSTSGPCLAQEAKNRNAREFHNEFPEASRAIIEDHYMDDYLGNADNIEEANTLIHEVIHIHKKGGFIICNWISNSKEVLMEIEPNLRAHEEKYFKESEEPTIERILGAWWNPEEDLFLFKTKFHKVDHNILVNKKRPTKREVLKVVMSIFDPLGFLTNFIIQGKILLQDIWRNNLGWDDEILDILEIKWKAWMHDLKKIYSFKIPRQYFTLDRTKSTIQLHIFTDASDKAYATVAYLRITHENNVQVTFVTAKARVARLKPMSIPRLELQGALMGARLGSYLKENLKLNISNVVFWTDSKTVLHWIRSEAGRFKVFVAQRLGEIQDLTNTTQWNYVPSKENAADDATKQAPLDFSHESRWIFGPKFLKEDPDKWPKEKIEEKEENVENFELKNDRVLVNFIKETLEVPDPKRFSKWTRILRSTAWMLRFIGNCRKRMKNGELQVSEIKNAEELLFRKIQLDSFYEEYECLSKTSPLNKKSRIYALSPELDKNKIIRMKGRLNNLIHFDYNFKNPIILDPKHAITKLIIHHYHEETFHYGQEIIINKLREKFWILHIRQAVKNASKNCQKCKILKSSPETPVMGQLPLCRLEPTIRCFIKTGIDYFGPIKIAVKRSTEKRYGVIFTCMTTRAIHLEISQDLSTDSFIHVLRQFGCRRGFPEEIYSDNGSNFKSAEKELSEALRKLNETDIKTFCTMKNIKWNFNPPLAPHMGGAWERLIQCVKKIMKEMLTTRCPQEYVLRTVFAEAENILNSRPLTHISVDSHDMQPLTPNHFLIGPSFAALPCTKTEETNLNLLTKWRSAQKLTDFFWKRWTTEYLPYLARRSKWHSETKPIKDGDVVIVVDPNGPRNMWPMGRIIHTYPAKDGKIRIVDVRLANGNVLRRPVTKICRLDVRDGSIEE